MRHQYNAHVQPQIHRWISSEALQRAHITIKSSNMELFGTPHVYLNLLEVFFISQDLNRRHERVHPSTATGYRPSILQLISLSSFEGGRTLRSAPGQQRKRSRLVGEMVEVRVLRETPWLISPGSRFEALRLMRLGRNATTDDSGLNLIVSPLRRIGA